MLEPEDFDFPIAGGYGYRGRPSPYFPGLAGINFGEERSPIHAAAIERRRERKYGPLDANGKPIKIPRHELGAFAENPSRHELYHRKQCRRNQAINSRPDDGWLLACRRVRVKDLPFALPPVLYINNLERNQDVPSCCRRWEDHHIAAFFSSREWMERRRKDGYPEPWGGKPDIYILYCQCGRQHITAQQGQGGHISPTWTFN
ncbi:MAG: hypothetical protein AB7O44_30385 [Hyphomicrobiaceae bacterium]